MICWRTVDAFYPGADLCRRSGATPAAHQADSQALRSRSCRVYQQFKGIDSSILEQEQKQWGAAKSAAACAKPGTLS